MNDSNHQLNEKHGKLPDNNCYKYDVAVSYDSHCKEFVKKVVMYLESDKFEVFFDLNKKTVLLSENLEAKLYQVYQNESLVKVLFVTNDYLENDYTLLEARRSFTSAKENHRRLIVVNFLGKDLPEPYSDYAYLDGNLTADEIAYVIGERIRELKKEERTNVKAAEASANTKIYIENINKIEHNSGITARDNANIHHISIHN